jgi:thioesterase domain-containing protein
LSVRDRVLIQLHQARAKGPLYPLIWARNRIAWELTRRRESEETGAEHAFHNAEIEAAFIRAVGAYRMRPWDGRLVLYRPPLQGKWRVSGGRMVSSERAYVTHDNDWGLYAPQVAVHEVPGDHDSMVLEPNVRVLAQLMRRAIAEAEADQPGGGEVLAFPVHAAE